MFMAKLSKQEREEKQLQVKQMYCKGFDAETIAAIMGNVSARTVAGWIRDGGFEKAKRSQVIALSEIRNSILESYADVLDGKPPRIKPNEAAAYAGAFEKFSSKKQVLTYMHEAYEMLSDEITADIQRAKKPVEKEKLLALLRDVRELCDKIITRTTNEVIGNEN
jgi:uncharacterized protein YjcR